MEETNNPQTPPVGFPGTTPVPQQQENKKNWKWLVILILFLVVIGGVTFFVFKSSRSSSTDEPTPEPTSDLTTVSTPVPTPSPTPADKTALNVSVLNGTGIAGEAGILADKLKTLGYTNVTTGNADSQNATTTTVDFGPNVSQDVVTEINSTLNDMYTSVSTDSSALPSGTDIQITTGTRKGDTASASPTDTSEPTATP
ncbi:MAG TPA: LytR C-terminal domain-containing protein [Patescibacteria group bacterium]|nr:LytR C-terminal domain-containing protein [Patescibacteria group bacterium]